MNMQSDNIEDLFRDNLSGFNAETTSSFDSRMMDSIINHVPAQSKWQQFSSKWGKAAAGLLTGTVMTSAVFLAKDWLHPVDTAELAVQNEQVQTTDRPNNANGLLGTASRTAEKQAEILTNDDDYQPLNRSLAENSTKQSIIGEDPGGIIASGNHENNQFPTQPTIGNRINENEQNNNFIAMTAPEQRNHTNVPIGKEMDQICYTNVGFSEQTAEFEGLREFMVEDLPAMSKEAKQRVKRQSVEVSAGVESYGQKNIEGNQTEIDIQKATLLYCAEFNNVELKTGISASQFGREKEYTYDYLKTDSVPSWFRVDYVDAEGNQVGEMQYDTVSNKYSSSSQALITDYRLSIPLLIGYRLGNKKVSASLFAGAEYYFYIAQSQREPEFSHNRVESYTTAEDNRKKSNMAFVGQMQIGYFATKKIQLFANGEYRRYLKPLIDNGQNQKQLPSVSANVGVKVYF